MREMYPLRRAQIDEQIATLVKYLGRPRLPVGQDKLRRAWTDGSHSGIANLIVGSMRLTGLTVKVEYECPELFLDSGATIDWRPNPVPIFGTEAFKKMDVRIHVRTSRLFGGGLFGLQYGIVSWTARAFAQILLGSIGHSLQNTQEAYDLTAMILGYREIYLKEAQDALSALEQKQNSLCKQECPVPGISLTAEEVVYANVSIDCIR